MWRKVGNILAVVLGCGVIIAYICYASYLAELDRPNCRVKELHISIKNDPDMCKFVSEQTIREQLLASSYDIMDCQIDSVDAVGISTLLADNGYVKEASAYVTHSGNLYVEVTQHRPLLRLMSGGGNHFVTKEGVLFHPPQGGAFYAPVVSGSYKPLFPPTYEGSVAEFYETLYAEEDLKIEELNAELSTVLRKRRASVRERSECKKDKKRGRFERESHWNQRKVGLELKMKECDQKIAVLDGKVAQLEEKKQLIYKQKKKLQKSYEDFMNLINFVTLVEESDFWSSEVVQFVANTTSLGEIDLALIPRSGNFVIEFGTLAERKEKLSKLGNFYDSCYSIVGEQQYKQVDVRYDKQVICTK
jgi:hypothetical protein